MANEVDITITASDMTGPAFASAIAKMLALRKAAIDTGQAFNEIGMGGFDINKAGTYLVQLRSKLQSLGIADIADVNIPQGKIITQLQVLKRVISQSGISDLIDLNVNPAQLTTQMNKLASMSETIPVNFDVQKLQLEKILPAEIIPVHPVVQGSVVGSEHVPTLPSGGTITEHFTIDGLATADSQLAITEGHIYDLNDAFGKATSAKDEFANDVVQHLIPAINAGGIAFNNFQTTTNVFSDNIDNRVTPAINRNRQGLGLWGFALTGLIGGIGIWHVALDAAIEAIIIVGTSAAAAAVGIAAMAPAAHNVSDGMQSLYDVSVSLNKTIYPLSGNFNALTKSLAPQVVGDFGGALNLVNQNMGVFDTTAREVSDLFSTWIAKLDLWSQSQGGVNKLLQTGVGFLTQFGQMAGNMLTAITNISRADPGTAHFLMDIFVGATDLFSAISKLPAPILQLGIAFHSVYVWGSVALGILSRMPGTIGSVASALVGLPLPIKLVLAALAAVSIELAGQWESASSSVSKSISTINSSLSTMSASSAILSISSDIKTLNTQMSTDSISQIQAGWTNLNTIWQQADANIQNLGTDLGKTVTGNSFMGQLDALGNAAKQVGVLIHAAVSGDVSGLNNQNAAATQLGNDYAQISAKIKTLVGDQGNLYHATGTLISGDNNLHLGHLSLVQSFGLLDAAGVNAGDQYDVMMQKVKNLVTGYEALTGGGTGLINSINAISFATLQGDSHVAALNTGWDTFLKTVSGGVDGLNAFQGALVTMATAGQISAKSLDGVTNQTVTLTGNFQTAYAAANSQADALTLLANASGGGDKAVGELNQGVKDYVALLLPAAKGSTDLTAELYALAQRGGYQGADSFKALSTWVGNTINPMGNLIGTTNKMTAAAAFLKQDVANLSVALGQTLNDAMAQVIETESGGLKPMEALYSAIATTGLYSRTTKTDALNLAAQFFTLTGNVTDAHKEFDTFATQALGLTQRQADTLWQSTLPKLQSTINSLHGKTVSVNVVGSGSGTITFAEQNIKNAQTGFLEFHAAGGPVRGPGGPKSDSIPAMLSPGEFVINAASANKIGYGKLFALNRMAEGGISALPNWMGNQEVYAGRQVENSAATMMIADMRAKVAAEIAAQKAMAALNYLPLGSGPASGSAAVAQAFAKSILFAYGWGMNQWPYELALWNQESGWNAYAANPTSDARGIPQNINGWSAYAPGDYQAQIRWGDAYISSRYGTPANAWAHEKAYNWYDNGGWLKPGMNVMMNGTGGWEHLSRDGAGHGGGVSLEISSTGSTAFEQFMVMAIREWVHVKGGGNVQSAFGH